MLFNVVRSFPHCLNDSYEVVCSLHQNLKTHLKLGEVSSRRSYPIPGSPFHSMQRIHIEFQFKVLQIFGNQFFFVRNKISTTMGAFLMFSRFLLTLSPKSVPTCPYSISFISTLRAKKSSQVNTGLEEYERRKLITE
jgi:hypothetical protein